MRLPAIAALSVLPALTAAAPDQPSAKPLPGNKACPYPPEAQKEYVAGPVRFVAQVRPDGTVESVEVRRVPLPRLGFEETVRACVSEWRFEPASTGQANLRRYEGNLRFQLDAAQETAIRALLEALAASWNASDKKGLEDLTLRSRDAPKTLPSGTLRSLREQLQGEGAEKWRMEVASEFKYLRFLGPDAVSVGQPIQKVPVAHPSGQTAETEDLTLDVFAAKGARGWRLVRVSPMNTTWLEGIRVGVGAGIGEPRKIRDARPRYPEVAKVNQIQGVVIMDCLITPEGKITAIRMLRGIPLLDAAAIEAVRQWEYTPTLVDGKPVPVIMTITVNFRLSRGPGTMEYFLAGH